MKFEKSADPLDHAAQTTQQHNDHAEQQRQAAERRRLQVYKKLLDDGDIDGVHCMVCEMPLPELRQKECRLRCTACETIKEKKDKR